MIDRIIKKSELIGEMRVLHNFVKYCHDCLEVEMSSPEGSPTKIAVISGVLERLDQEYQRITGEWEKTRRGAIKK